MSPRTRRRERGARSGAEWVSFGVASAVVLVLVGLLVVTWVGGPLDEPAFEVLTDGGARTDHGQHFVVAKVENTGDETAENVEVLAELLFDEEVVEEATQTIDFLSGGEVEEVTFAFVEDPRQGHVDVRVVSYGVP